MIVPMDAPSGLAAPPQASKATTIALVAAAAVLNAMFLVFFVLWSEADEWAVDRSEARGGFDPAQLLPHDGLMWVAAHVALAALLVCDVLGVVVFVRLRKVGAVRFRRVDVTAGRIKQ